MAELRETITRKEIESVKPVPKKKGSYRVADSVTAEQHHQAFDVIVKALSRNVKCFLCISCVLLVILAASVSTVTVFILDMNNRVTTGNETCARTLDNLKNATDHLAQKNEKLQNDLEEQKKSQSPANATITRLKAKLEEFEDFKKNLGDLQEEIEKLKQEKKEVKGI